jgi:hypothetical protein
MVIIRYHVNITFQVSIIDVCPHVFILSPVQGPYRLSKYGHSSNYAATRQLLELYCL